MTAWIFRAKPEQLDLDAILSGSPETLDWHVARRASELRPGDQVFLWRSSAAGKRDAKLTGIVAEAVVGSVRATTSDGSGDDATVLLRISRVELKERFQSNWFSYDPIMSRAVLKSEADMVVRLTPEQSVRMNALWRRAKVGWTYAEVVAGLWAFKRTLGGQISRMPDSPVAVAALRTGRVMQGMYNKVQHFRALDPNDKRTGLTSSSLADREVWNRFFDPAAGRLREDDIEAEFQRLWPEEVLDPLPPKPDPEIAAEGLSRLGLAELMERYAKSARGRTRRPRSYRTSTTSFDRDPIVIAIARLRADHRCEVPECGNPLFLTAEGARFVEVHHIVPLADGGDDTPENVACVCPSHHREAHHGQAAASIKAGLQTLRAAEVRRADFTPPPGQAAATADPDEAAS